ncbi:hypothetical protein J6590_016359 [Homalodisca vitripennis]|nr:hypothetical protein J6590_016359 [Homalodisca vitripennis]
MVTPIIRAIFNQDVEGLREALDRGFSANLPGNRGWTPLHAAVVFNASSECLKELLAHSSANVNSQTFLGYTPLLFACQKGCLNAVNLLLKQSKCDVNLANIEEVRPLNVACSKGNFEIVQLLVEFGAQVNAQDYKGYTALHEAVLYPTSRRGVREQQDEMIHEICHFLLRHNANPDVLEDEGNFPFHFACQSGLLKTLTLLFTASTQRDLINFRNKDGRTPLILAVQSHNLSVVEALISQGANANVADNMNYTPLHHACNYRVDFDIFNALRRVTSDKFILKYCTFDEERDFEVQSKIKIIYSLICLAIDTEDLSFLVKVLESNFDPAVLQCPEILEEYGGKERLTLLTPISYLLQMQMYNFGEKTIEFLLALINHGSPLKVVSKVSLISYVDPICACLAALNYYNVSTAVRCIRILLQHGADPDEPHGRMPHAMEQACKRGCAEAVLLLLQYSNVLEPEDVIRWIEQETSTEQQEIVKVLLPLAPYYTPSDRLLPDLVGSPQRKALLAPKVYPLTNYCRTVIRRQVREESKTSLSKFRQNLFDLFLPKDLCMFLSYM